MTERRGLGMRCKTTGGVLPRAGYGGHEGLGFVYTIYMCSSLGPMDELMTYRWINDALTLMEQHAATQPPPA